VERHAGGQLEYSVVSDGGALHEPERRPSVPQGALTSGADIVIYLPDDLAGQQARCEVRGYYQGRPQGQGEARAAIVAGDLVDVQIRLPGSGGKDGGMSPDGGGAGQPDAGGSRRQANGQSCGAGDDCSSGHCADAVCCDGACLGVCLACNVPGKAGSCTALTVGARDPLCAQEAVAACGLDGTCNGQGACRSYPDGTACRPGKLCFNGRCR
jgi:hypothetical protein